MWLATNASGVMMGGWSIALTVLIGAVVLGAVLSLVVFLTRRKSDSDKESAWGTLQRRYKSGEFPKKKSTANNSHHEGTGSCCH